MDDYSSIFAPKKGLRRTPPKPTPGSRGPTPAKEAVTATAAPPPTEPTPAAPSPVTFQKSAKSSRRSSRGPTPVRPAAVTPVPEPPAAESSPIPSPAPAIPTPVRRPARNLGTSRSVAVTPVAVEDIAVEAAVVVTPAAATTPGVPTPRSILRPISRLIRDDSEEPMLRAMTSPIRDIDDQIQVPASSNSIVIAQTPRASTAEPVTPSFRRLPSSAGKASARRQTGTTPHTKRAYANRPTPHKNQNKRRNSRFMDEEDEPFMALKQLSRLEASKTQPWKDTPKAITPKAASARRRTLDGIRIDRDINALSDEDDDTLEPHPRLSGVSIKILGNYNNDDDELTPPPRFSSPMKEEEGDDTILGTPGEVARRAVADNDRRASFAPDPFDRFRIFDNVDMDDSVMPMETGFEEAMVDDDFAAVAGEGISNLSFADETGELPQDGDVSNFFNVQGDEETDFRLEHVAGDEPPELVNDISSPPSLGDGGIRQEEFVDSDFDSDGPLTFEEGVRSVDGAQMTKLTIDDSGRPAKKQRTKKELPVSAYGIPYPSMPPKVVKAIIGRSTKAKLSKETLNYIMAASETYFENLGEDLGSFARHAKRKTVEEEDVMQVLRRHRLLNDKTTVFSLANQYLPRELLQDIKIQVPKKNLPKQKRRRLDDEDAGDVTI